MAFNEQLVDTLRQKSVFKGLTMAQMQEIMSAMKEHEFNEGENVIEEDQINERLWIIVEGEISILKKEDTTDRHHQLSTLGPGDIIGEVSVLDHQHASATCRVKTKSKLLSLDSQTLNTLSKGEKSVDAIISSNLAQVLSERLRQVNITTVKSLQQQLRDAKKRVGLGHFISSILVLNSGYVLALQFATQFGNRSADTTLILMPILFVFAAGILFAIKKSGYPYSMYGLNTIEWKKAVVESLVFTIPVLALIIVLKWVFVSFTPTMAGECIFDLCASRNQTAISILISSLAYCVFTPVQEFTRAGVQSAFAVFLVGKYKNMKALLIANLLFSMSHIHISIAMVFIVFLPGLFWGWMYNRHRTLIGISISHIIVGLFAFYVVGVTSLK
jgi:CRP-like cAMP-binding protein